MLPLLKNTMLLLTVLLLTGLCLQLAQAQPSSVISYDTYLTADKLSPDVPCHEVDSRPDQKSPGHGHSNDHQDKTTCDLCENCGLCVLSLSLTSTLSLAIATNITGVPAFGPCSFTSIIPESPQRPPSPSAA